MRPSGLDIVIDELVMRGLPPATAQAAATELEARLAELASGGATIPQRAESFRRLPAIEAPAGRLGEAVAGAVWGVVSGGTAS